MRGTGKPQRNLGIWEGHSQDLKLKKTPKIGSFNCHFKKPA